MKDARGVPPSKTPSRVREPDLPSLPTFRGRGLQPGVDLDDTPALLDRMEGRDAPS
jgi:hypothetical protein